MASSGTDKNRRQNNRNRDEGPKQATPRGATSIFRQRESIGATVGTADYDEFVGAWNTLGLGVIALFSSGLCLRRGRNRGISRGIIL